MRTFLAFLAGAASAWLIMQLLAPRRQRQALEQARQAAIRSRQQLAEARQSGWTAPPADAPTSLPVHYDR